MKAHESISPERARSAALGFVNGVRGAYGAPTLADLQRGSRCSGGHCPITNSLKPLPTIDDVWTDKSRLSFSRQGLCYRIPLPEEVAAFLWHFDELAAYPDLEY